MHGVDQCDSISTDIFLGELSVLPMDWSIAD